MSRDGWYVLGVTLIVAGLALLVQLVWPPRQRADRGK
jgi:hypothetical protein